MPYWCVHTESNSAALAASLLWDGGHQQQPHTHSPALWCFGNSLTPWHTLSEHTFPFKLPLNPSLTHTSLTCTHSSPSNHPSSKSSPIILTIPPHSPQPRSRTILWCLQMQPYSNNCCSPGCCHKAQLQTFAQVSGGRKA